MKSASNGGILQGRLQVLHIHVLLVAPLGTGHMAQPGTDQHQSRVSVREATHYTGAASDLSIQPLNHIVGADAGPVLAGEITVSQSLLNAILHLLGSFFQLHGAHLAASFSFMERNSSTTTLTFSRAAFLLSWAWIALSILATSFTLERGVTEKTLR